jgi:hypothetical protein
MSRHGTMSHAHPGAISAAGARELAKDPICGMMVDKATALTTERAGRTTISAARPASEPSRIPSASSSRCGRAWQSP